MTPNNMVAPIKCVLKHLPEYVKWPAFYWQFNVSICNVIIFNSWGWQNCMHEWLVNFHKTNTMNKNIDLTNRGNSGMIYLGGWNCQTTSAYFPSFKTVNCLRLLRPWFSHILPQNLIWFDEIRIQLFRVL
jgi:hypothetical protein